MENANTNGLMRTKSDQLVESVVAALKSSSPPSSDRDHDQSTRVVEGGGTTLTRKPSRRASPGGKNTHIRKARSAQLKVELDEVSSGAALSRASSASLGLSFSFTGFTVPPDEIADSKPFSDDDIRKFYFPYIYNIHFKNLMPQLYYICIAINSLSLQIKILSIAVYIELI